jgi:ribosomal protein S27AE
MGYVPVRTPLLCHDGEVVNGNAADGTYHFDCTVGSCTSSASIDIGANSSDVQISPEVELQPWSVYLGDVLLSDIHPDVENERTPRNTRTCPYCGMANDPEWLTCGQGQWWGCGAQLEEDDNVPQVSRKVTRLQELKVEIGEQFMKAISRTLGPLLKAVR